MRPREIQHSVERQSLPFATFQTDQSHPVSLRPQGIGSVNLKVRNHHQDCELTVKPVKRHATSCRLSVISVAFGEFSFGKLPCQLSNRYNP